jgi:hypothetical protein
MDDATRSALLEFFASEGETLVGAVQRIQEIDPAPQLDAETTAQFVNGFAVIATEALTQETTEAYDLYVEGASVAMQAQSRSAGSLASTMAICAGIFADELAARVEPSVRAGSVDWLACFVGKFTEDTIDVMKKADA